MAIICPRCGREYDITLFAFWSRVKCDCGINLWLDPEKGVVTEEQ